MNYKKGIQLTDAPQIVLLLVFVSLIAIVGIKINDSLQTTDSGTITTAINETVALSNNSYTALTYSRALYITSLGNATETMGSANYTLLGNKTASSVQFLYSNGTGAAGGVAVDGNYWVYYTYDIPSEAYYAAGNSTTGIEQITSQLALVGLIVIMSVVITLLWGSFKFGNQGSM